jgi:hypothetical protein
MLAAAARAIGKPDVRLVSGAAPANGMDLAAAYQVTS